MLVVAIYVCNGGGVAVNAADVKKKKKGKRKRTYR